MVIGKRHWVDANSFFESSPGVGAAATNPPARGANGRRLSPAAAIRRHLARRAAAARRQQQASIINGQACAPPTGLPTFFNLQGPAKMKICPVAIAVGCAKCPIYKACPLKGVIGDYVKPQPPVRKAAGKETGKAARK
jgi:hypothetical protein